MSVVEGFEVLIGTYLGQDWDLFGVTPTDAIAQFLHGASPADIAASVVGFQELLASSMNEQELDHRWIYELHSGYDPRDDGHTYREWFTLALELVRAGPVGPKPELPRQCGDPECSKCRPTSPDDVPPDTTDPNVLWWWSMARGFRRGRRSPRT